MTRVCGEEVEYIGWKLYGISAQDVPVGAYLIWPNPLAADAVIEPVWPVLRSTSTARRPCEVSCRLTLMWSPARMNSTLGLVGLPEVRGLNCSGLGGPIGLPECVRKAKFTYSVPPRISPVHVGLSVVPLTGSSDRLSIVIAAHHCRGSQLEPSNCFSQPGG